MIDIRDLHERMSRHVASCRSAPFLCTAYASFESWFRVELAPVLWDMGYAQASIDPNYNYPGSKAKADLCIRRSEGDIVFELKSFVRNQDRNKIEKYPEQIKRLEKLISDLAVSQVITLTTFIGYTSYGMSKLMNDFFGRAHWDRLGPVPLIEQYPLHIAITTLGKKISDV